MGLLPAELAVKAVKERMMPWALHAVILDFEEGAGKGVNEHLVHTKYWRIAAAMRVTLRQCSKLALQMTPVYDAPKKMVKALEECLAGPKDDAAADLPVADSSGNCEDCDAVNGVTHGTTGVVVTGRQDDEQQGYVLLTVFENILDIFGLGEALVG